MDTEVRRRLERTLARIDAANDADPSKDLDGVSKARRYGERMSEALAQLEGAPSEPLLLAVRAQHIERWVIPRATHPEGRAGYLAWRARLAAHHAERLGELMAVEGYDAEAIARAQSIVAKKRRGSDPEAQALEDCACLVFLRYELDAFASQHDEAKVVDVLRKTWRKMSAEGQRLALALPLAPRAAELVARALAT